MIPATPSGSGPSAVLDRATVLEALESLSDELARAGVVGEACLFGGTVMMLVYAARVSTKDVDALFRPAPLVRELAGKVADRLQLPADWLNDGVKGFLSSRHDVSTGDLPQYPNLRLTMPVPEYLLAMKCMAARMGGTAGEPSDVADIAFLVRRLGLRSAGEVLELVGRYYPPERVPVKTRYLVEGLFEEGAP